MGTGFNKNAFPLALDSPFSGPCTLKGRCQIQYEAIGYKPIFFCFFAQLVRIHHINPQQP